jgi:hypothetical protein
MKRDQKNRRLRLRKESLRQLDPVDLDQVAGGRGAAPRTYECTRSDPWRVDE